MLPDTDEVLALGPPSAVSRMALDIDAVSPFRKASTMRNLRTDCSSVAPLVSIDALGGECWVDGVRARFALEPEGLELWRLDSRGLGGGCDMAAVEDG